MTRLLATMLANDGADPTKVEVVNVGFDLVPALLGSRSMPSSAPTGCMRRSWPSCKASRSTSCASRSSACRPTTSWSSSPATRRSPSQADLARRFLRATGRGYADAAQDQKAAIDLLVKVNPETNREMEERGLPLLAPLWTQGRDDLRPADGRALAPPTPTG